MKPGLVVRFWAKVQIGRKKDCWPWLGAIDTPGYGAFKFDGKKRNAHRVAYELANGPPLPGVWIEHTCDNPPCCNPAHLKPGTPKSNVDDMDRKGRRRQARGVDAARARLTDEAVASMRREYVETEISTGELAARFGVSQKTVQKILRGDGWSHVPTPEDYAERFRQVSQRKKYRRPPIARSASGAERAA